MFSDDIMLPCEPILALEFGKKSVSALFYKPELDFFACPRVQISPEQARQTSLLQTLAELFAFTTPLKLVEARSASLDSRLFAPFLAEQSGANFGDKRFFHASEEVFSSTLAVKPALCMDSFGARVQGLLALPALQKRNFREGLTILHVGKGRIHASLVFQNKMYGYFSAPFLPSQDLQGFLETFRLGWLPPEKAALVGGISFLTPHLPAEAEGFKPLYIFGSNAEALKNLGQVVNLPFDQQFLACWGLLFALANSQS